MSLSKGRKLKDEGIAKVSANHREFIDKARALALRIVKRNGMVSINDVRRYLIIPKTVHPNAIGAIFKDKRLKPVGYELARHTAAHARAVKLYELADL